MFLIFITDNFIFDCSKLLLGIYGIILSFPNITSKLGETA